MMLREICGHDMTRLVFIGLLVVASTGCSYIDWNGPWFGCPKEQIEKPATRGMFGSVKASAKCVPVDESAYPAYSSERQAQRKKDFQECTGMQTQSKESVKDCMARKGWTP